MFSLKTYVYKVMKNEERGFFVPVMRILLSLLSFLYAFGERIVGWMYDSGMLRMYKAPVPVISIGNITLGGTGKTPFTIFVADYFTDNGKKPAVLIRGYGDDEHRMLKDALPDIPVLVGRDRVKNAFKEVVRETDVLVLDDGYQHRRLERDLNILLLDCPNPFGNGHLCPRGILREPVSSIRRADMIVLTKADRMEESDRENIVQKINGLAPGVPVIISRHEPVCMRDVTGAVYSTDELSGKKICLVSGIADPEYFAHTVRACGGIIVEEITFGDHYGYAQQDVDRIFAKCFSSRVDMLLVTEKDHVKMKKLDLTRIEEKLYVLCVRIDIIDQKERFIAGLNSVISG